MKLRSRRTIWTKFRESERNCSRRWRRTPKCWLRRSFSQTRMTSRERGLPICLNRLISTLTLSEARTTSFKNIRLIREERLLSENLRQKRHMMKLMRWKRKLLIQDFYHSLPFLKVIWGTINSMDLTGWFIFMNMDSMEFWQTKWG